MAEELNDGGRVAYLEARVGELHQTIGDLRAGWRDADQQHARDVCLLLWLHAEAEWQRDEFKRQLADAVAMVMVCTGHPDSGFPSHFDELQRLRREVEFDACGTNPSRDGSTDLEALEIDFHERARLRAEADGRGDAPQCDGDCGNDDCHMTSAVAAWQMAAAAVRRLINELGSRPQCAVHPDGGE